MKKIIAISGSLREASYNTRVLQALVLLSDSIDIRFFNRISEFPHFSTDLEQKEIPEAVQDFYKSIKAADGVIFCTPEYAYGVPGVLKNALDWCVSANVFNNKPTAVISASTGATGGDKAFASLLLTLGVINADVPIDCMVSIPMVSAKLNEENEITDTNIKNQLILLLKTLEDRINS